MAEAALSLVSLVEAVRHDGYVLTPGANVARLLGPQAMADWPAFAASWDDLGPDRYMADGGRYRRRRHAAFRIADGMLTRKPHQPHFQSRDYNALNGGVQRWFEPVTEVAADSAAARGLLGLAAEAFGDLSGRPSGPWHVETHQFRIEAAADEAGLPTPEGMHRDGVDWVLVLLVGRSNVAEGVTEIGAADGTALGRFVLAEPLDAVFLDDARIRHAVTPIRPIDPSRPAWRDALVATFTAE